MTPVEHIWNDLFQCRIKRLDLIGTEEIQQRGLFTYGDQYQDREMLNEMVLTYRTIKDMVILHSQGVKVVLTSRKDAIRIYELVNQHLITWLNHLKWSGMYKAPYQDLKDMDSFVSDVHATVKFDLTKSIDKSIFSDRLNALTTFSRNRLAAKKTYNNRALSPEELQVHFPSRDSLSDILDQYRIEGGLA